MHVDLSNHIPNLGSLNVGSLSFWIKTDGLNTNDESVEQTYSLPPTVKIMQPILG